jgi:hypothetical protein
VVLDVLVSTTGAATRSASARPLVATVEIVAFAAVAHVGAGGALPTFSHLLALVAVVAVASGALRHRLVGVGTAAVVATLGQVALHAVASGSPGHGDHEQHAMHVGSADTATEMWLAHALAAAATLLALHWQEQVLHAVVRLLVPDSSPLFLDHPPRPLPGAPRLPRRTAESLVVVAPRRGPPALPASAWS